MIVKPVGASLGIMPKAFAAICQGIFLLPDANNKGNRILTLDCRLVYAQQTFHDKIRQTEHPKQQSGHFTELTEQPV